MDNILITSEYLQEEYQKLEKGMYSPPCFKNQCTNYK